MKGEVTDDSIKLYKAISEVDGEPRVMEQWHASSLAECPRAQYLKRLGSHLPANEEAVSAPSAAKILRWDAGHVFEGSIRKHLPAIFDKDEEILSNKRLFSLKRDLTGEYDNYAVNAKTLVEIKTVHDYAFIQRDNDTYLKLQDGVHEGGRWDGKPKYVPNPNPYLHHEIQNHAYAILLDEGTDVSLRGVKKIKYVYISLSGRMVTYETDIKPKILGQVNKRLDVLNKAWAEKIAPECICKPNHPLWGPVMQWCDFRTETGCCLEEVK